MLDASLVQRLALPGLPEWTGLLVLCLGLMVLLAFAAMPFSVFGLKSRLDSLEARLDEIQQEIRGLSLRLPEPGPPPRRPAQDEGYDEPPRPVRAEREPRLTPPIPPPPAYPEATRRQEPRLGSPRR